MKPQNHLEQDRIGTSSCAAGCYAQGQETTRRPPGDHQETTSGPPVVDLIEQTRRTDPRSTGYKICSEHQMCRFRVGIISFPSTSFVFVHFPRRSPVPSVELLWRTGYLQKLEGLGWTLTRSDGPHVRSFMFLGMFFAWNRVAVFDLVLRYLFLVVCYLSRLPPNDHL